MPFFIRSPGANGLSWKILSMRAKEGTPPCFGFKLETSRFDFQWLHEFLELANRRKDRKDGEEGEGDGCKLDFVELAKSIARSRTVPVSTILRYLPSLIPAVRNLEMSVDIDKGASVREV